MFDRTEPDAAAPAAGGQPRARGLARIVAAPRDGATRLAGLRQEGAAKAMTPRTAGPALEAVLVNTAGGVTGGDAFRYEGRAEAGAHLVLTTQAAERAYKAQPGETGRIDVRLFAGPGARLNWLPQETILYDRSALARRLEAEIAPDAAFLAAETLVFGRAAMGERLGEVDFTDHWRIRRGGRLVFAEAFRLSGPARAALDGPAALAGAGAAATILYAAPDAEARLGAVRALLPARGGASAFDDLLAIRMMAADSMALRAALVPLVELLGGGPAPKVWRL